MTHEYAQGRDLGSPRRRRLRVGRIAIAVAAIVALVSAIAYAYDLGFRRGARHAPPLIAADPSPTKAPPDTPGGIAIPHQDKLVYQRLATAQEPVAAITKETLLPPPEEPLPKPAPEPARQVVSASDSTAVGDAAPVDGNPAPATPVRGQEPASVASVAKAADGEPARPDKPRTVVVTDAPQQAAAVAPATAEPRAAAPILQLTAPPIDAPYLVQVGSFRTPDTARAGWQQILKRHRGLLERLTHRVAQVDLGGGRGIYHRLQVGSFDSRSGADGLCRKLKAAGQDCLVVKR